LAAVCALNALLAGRRTDVLTLMAKTARALADIEIAMLTEIIPPRIGIVVRGGFVQNEPLSVDTAAIGPHPIQKSQSRASGRVAVPPIPEGLGSGEGGRVGERETDLGVDGIIRNPAVALEAGAGEQVARAVVGEHGRLLAGAIDRVGRERLRLRLRRSAHEVERLDQANS